MLEHIDYGMQTIEEIESELSRLVDKGVLEPEDLAEIDRKEILEILNSPAINYARQNKYYREVEFAMQVKASDIIDTKVDDEVFVQGAIDLLVAGEEVWIVDFKKTDERTDILVDRYKTQLKLYSLAVEKAIGRKPDKAMLLIIGRNEQIEIKL
ncbi:MAG: PD-(D/E)XK nuclease family protein [Clostridia bacterium]|nr:PD-(D/E)XK nuclease family protein [Clostridia bacterium]